MAQDSELSLFLLQNQIQKAVQIGLHFWVFAKGKRHVPKKQLYFLYLEE